MHASLFSHVILQPDCVQDFPDLGDPEQARARTGGLTFMCGFCITVHLATHLDFVLLFSFPNPFC